MTTKKPTLNRSYPQPIPQKPGLDQETGLNDARSYFGDRFTHPACLEKLCLGALMRGDFESAFRYIDRRCRIAPSPTADHFLLRAEALEARSERAAALASLDDALRLAPFDLQANRRMLAWGKGEARLRAARVLCERDDHPATLPEAAKALKQGGAQAVGSIRVFDTHIRGWAAWNGDNAPQLINLGEGFEEHVRLAADPQQTLKKSGFKNGAAFEWARDPKHKLQRAELRCGKEVFVFERISAKRQHPGGRCGPQLKRVKAVTRDKTALTIVIPIYRDFEATRACLESVRRETANLAYCKVILVNDHSPENKIGPYLSRFAKGPKTALLTNPHNLGFVGSVNRALATIDEGDIILLNADTVLPGGAIQRLRATAHKDPHIGTITPLSNNGEFMSFPMTLRANPMPSQTELAVLDRSAAQVNKNIVVDVPSGIGFCLFISAECLKAVGGLSDSFQGGYLEDVDFCLRAREKGFRNVCDAAVFVAHAGSRSFLADKRNLVVRNLPIIEERFPNDQAETQAFLRHDPLQSARAALERVMTAKATFDLLIVSGKKAARIIVEERARSLVQNGLRVWFAIVADGVISFVNAASSMPQSLSFRFDAQNAREDLRAYVQGLRFSHIELTDPVLIPADVLPVFLKPTRSLDLFLADGTWMLDLKNAHAREGAKAKHSKSHAASLAGLSKFKRFIVPDKEAQYFVQHILPERADSITVEAAPVPSKAALSKSVPSKRTPLPIKSGNSVCGIISYGRGSDDFHLIAGLAKHMRHQTGESRFVVLGETFDDFALMALGNVFITAAFETKEFASLVKLYRIEKLFAAMRRPLFGHPLTRLARATGLPLGYFDWSFGALSPRHGDLALNTDLDAEAIAPRLASWMTWRR